MDKTFPTKKNYFITATQQYFAYIRVFFMTKGEKQ